MALSGTERLPFTTSRPSTEETPHACPMDVDGVADDLTLTEATELLDWLEGHGIAAREVHINEAGRMTVRWS
jgi:hypothetical protein